MAMDVISRLHSWGDFEMAVNAFFKNQKIWTVELAVVDPRFGKSWSEHSEEKEIQRKRFHDQILSDIFGGRYRVFDWGSVWSEYDPNGGSSSFGIHYGGSDPSNPGPLIATNESSPTSRAVTTPTSRSVSMISHNPTFNPVIDVRPRW